METCISEINICHHWLPFNVICNGLVLWFILIIINFNNSFVFHFFFGFLHFIFWNEWLHQFLVFISIRFFVFLQSGKNSLIIMSHYITFTKLMNSHIFWMKQIKMLLMVVQRVTATYIFINWIFSILHFFKINLLYWFIVWKIFWKIIIRFKSFIMSIWFWKFWSKHLKIKIYKSFCFILLCSW